ncbi:PREDICTED: cleft lip and palate transmembrane protein 1-like protein [Acropora digitifera]|uniref:cleft lip and palate transmembrane protein 1-like protein n=1 Tax=Acropora digitifera TaxID=70779 RepID=UPI00077AEB3C|nr:PREDICTED: cleft lip and palate transmembrane protein 1-like protein [Acropora digitifera]
MELKVKYSPISLGKLRIWASVYESFKTMKRLGFSDKDLDEMRGIFTDTNLFLLAVTFGITVLHLLFDFLAFKNDINYWKRRNSMVGLSMRTVIWRCVSTFIIFLYLMDEKTSLLVLIPAGIGSLIECNVSRLTYMKGQTDGRTYGRMNRLLMTLIKISGFSDKDLDEMRGIFTDTNLFLLAVTFGITVLHLLFDFLAFKNDINYWKRRNSMVGLSMRTVIWRCVSTFIIFLYLMDEKTSLLVLIPAGIGSLIEIWKVAKAFKVEVKWEKGSRPMLQFGQRTEKEKETEEFDSEAMRYLSYALYPLLVAGAVYSLIYYPHKSWYSWIIRSLVNGKLSILHFPKLKYCHGVRQNCLFQAFNTFIDDVFAFIIMMPTAHRLACFRDDLVFVIYLYQRWLYPVDMKRVNEYGVSFEEQDKQEKPHKE